MEAVEEAVEEGEEAGEAGEARLAAITRNVTHCLDSGGGGEVAAPVRSAALSAYALASWRSTVGGNPS